MMKIFNDRMTFKDSQTVEDRMTIKDRMTQWQAEKIQMTGLVQDGMRNN